MMPSTMRRDPVPLPRVSAIDRLVRRAVLSTLGRIERGRLRVVDAQGTHELGVATDDCPLEATLYVHDPRFYRDLAFGGSIAAGESYARGCWSADDLTSAIRIVAANRAAGERLDRRAARLRTLVQTIVHRLRRNSRAGSRRNVAAHYDLGNDFFEAFLDPTMMYSCALFETPSATLEQASRAKLALICDKLELSPSDELLEIGTGWGGLAVYAAEHYGCRVVTTTISRKQHAYASARVRRAGLGDRVDVLCEDYRDLPRLLGRRFDKLASIEMIEAIGHRRFDSYFRTCSELLRSDGMALLQAIVIRDDLYEQYKRSVDFIQRYIFPGGCLPSVSAMTASMGRETDFTLFDLQDLTPHYATTLRHWRERFAANADHVRELGYDERFRRLWDYYFSYCEAGFRERSVCDVQLLLTKPRNRRSPLPVVAAGETVRG